jgi:hypothetical protein
MGTTDALSYNKNFSILRTTCICRIDLDQNVYHVFAPNGMLIKRINFTEMRELYGTPVAQSFNGRLLAFRRTNTYLHLMSKDVLLGPKTLERAMTFALLEMTPSGMRFIKYVNLWQGIQRSFEK